MLASTMTKRTPSDRIPGELALIESIRGQAARGRTRAVRMGIGDDCAVLRPRAGYEICVTTDFSLEGRHFRREWHPPQSAGHRCLARGLSDLAAMGADPLAVFLSLAVPARAPASWVDGFLKGLLALARTQDVPLAGGDTAESPHGIAADIVAVGQVPPGAARMRSGARPGDALYVTGALGGAAAELRALSQEPAKFRHFTRAGGLHPHLYPEPRLEAGRRLRRIATAMIDISDGLSTDLMHLCRASGVAADLEEESLPVHPLALKEPDAMRLALHGGEDYELLFTAAAKARVPRRIGAVPVTRIGTMRREGRGTPLIKMRTRNGGTVPLQAQGWEHFR
jgi:thiamine-monophosphate kinase